MGRLKILMQSLLSITLHLAAGGAILYFLKPVLLWYWNYRPILGIDFYNLTSYVGFLARHFALPLDGWKYIWYTGGPLANDYPILHAYLVLPLLSYFSLPQAVQAYVLGSAFLFFFFSYLLFSEIGKDRVLAVVLVLASAFSIGFYGPVVWGGGLQYVATEFFLPLTLYLLVKYFNTDDKRWYYTSALFLGVSFLGHPQVGVSYLLPISFLLLLVFPKAKENYFSREKIGRIFVYFFIAILIGYPHLSSYFGKSPAEILTTVPTQVVNIVRNTIGAKKFVAPNPNAPQGGAQAAQPDPAIIKYNRDQLKRFFTDTNKLFIIFLPASIAIFIISFLVRRQRKKSFKGFVYALPALWVAGYISLQALGIGFFQGGWFRSFWAFPLALGIFISFSWGDFWVSLKERLEILDKTVVAKIVTVLISGALMALGGFYLLGQNSYQQMITKIESPGYRQQSSAFPDSLNIYIGKEEFKSLATRLVPSWLDPNDTQYRLYDADQRVNIWWNALFDMPLLRGYIEFPPGDSMMGTFYLTSVSLTSGGAGGDQLVESWGFSPQAAYNNALFLIDWFSIKYIEAEHEKSDSYNPLTSYLVEGDIFSEKEKVIIPGWVQLYEIPAGKPLIFHPNEEEYLTYYSVRDDLVSPITHTTNAPAIGIIGPLDGYNTIFRNFANLNLNSQKIIPVRLGQFIDDVPYESLKDMDAVILYAYDYRDHGKVWGRLEKYVKEGGKVFIETGSDVKQTDSVNLPSKYPRELPTIFPLKATKQEKIGTEWQLSGDSKEIGGLNLESFGPPMIDSEPWLFSMPNSSKDLREGAKVVLSANEIPLIVTWKYGEGEVIWSGMNLPYHINTHKSLEEAKLLENLLGDSINISTGSYSGFETKRESANTVVIKGKNAKGALFRENSNPGWTASLESKGKNQKLRIYQTGPTYWGFSYVRLPQEAQDSFMVKFSYRGELWVYFWWVIWLATVLLICDRVFFGARFLVPLFRKALTPFKAKIGTWWEKEEEE